MSRNPESDSELSEIAREARAWVVLMMDGRSTAAERDALRRWRMISPSHDAAFREAQRLRLLANLASDGLEVEARPMFTRRRLFFGAAAAAGGFHVAGILGMVPRWGALAADYATARGEQRRIDLPDALTVELDGESTIDLARRVASTEIWLHSGAVYFDVRTPYPKPLVAFADTWEIRAQDAAFTLKHGVDDVELACARGSVSAIGEVGRGEISAKEAIRLSKKGFSNRKLVLESEFATWRQGSLVYRGAPLGEVVADVNRHRSGRILILEATLEAREVNGVFALAGIDRALDQIAASLSLRVTALPGGVALLSTI